MSGPTTTASSQPDPTSASGKGEGENKSVGTGGGEPTPSQSPTSEQQAAQIATLQQNYAASSRQEQQNRLMLENERQQRIALETQIAAQTQPQTQTPLPLNEAAASLKKAMYAEDEAGIAAALGNVVTQASKAGAEEANKQAKQDATAQQRRLKLNQYFNPYAEHFSNSQDPIIQRTLQLYGQLESDPANDPHDDTVSLEVAPGVHKKINLHLLKEAHQTSIIESYSNPDQDNTQPAPVFMEASRSPGPRTASTSTKSVRSLLTAGEIETALNPNMGFVEDGKSEDEALQSYFDNFSDNLKETRKKTGGPVATADLIAAGLMTK